MMITRNLKGGYQMKVDRLVSMIMILLDQERIGAQELADMFVENNSGGLSQMSKEDILSLFTM